MEGSLEDMGIAELIQHLCAENKSGQVIVQHGERQAEIYITNGNVIHARLEEKQGEEVIYEVLGWTEGRFRFAKCEQFPAQTVHANWAVLLMEGARRLDEKRVQQEKGMAHMDDILKQMAGEIDGFMAAAVVGMDGLNIAQYSRAKVNMEAVGAQLTLFFKLMDSSVEKVQAGSLVDNLLSTQESHIIMRYLPDRKGYLGVLVDRKNGNLGNLRMVTGVYLDRIAKAIAAL